MPADPDDVPPEQLNGFRLVHTTLRKGGRDLQAATARFGETTRDPAALAQLWGFYARGLRVHHHGEDEVVFPLVVSRRPDFADVEADLRREHRTIDDLLGEADIAMKALASDPSVATANRARDALGQLNEVLDLHLKHEEDAALPVIAAAIPEDEMAKIEKGFLREIPRRDLGLSLAALDATTKEHPDLHLPPVPKPALVLLSLVWRRKYAALLARAGF